MDYESVKGNSSFTGEEYELDIKEGEVVIGSYLLDIQGYLSVLQPLQCQNCLGLGYAFVRMDHVLDDIAQGDPCPNCTARKSLKILYAEYKGEGEDGLLQE